MGDGCMLLDGRNQHNLRKQFIPQLKQNTDSVVMEKLWFRADSSLGAGMGATFLKTYGQATLSRKGDFADVIKVKDLAKARVP